jgi:hypothetical protein
MDFARLLTGTGIGPSSGLFAWYNAGLESAQNIWVVQWPS